MTATYINSNRDIASISDNLLRARRTRTSLNRFPGELPKTLEAAYRIQDLSIANWEDKLVGWKVGGIPAHLHSKFQDERLSGPIYESNVKRSDNNDILAMPIFTDGYAGIEAEFIIELADTSDLPDTGIKERQLVEAIEKVYIGVEIASSPIQRINDLGPVAPISDFGNNSGMIIGPEIEDWQHVGLSNIDVTVEIDGVVHGPTRTQSGLDGPLGAAKFLIEQLKRRRYKIEPGTFILTGAITGVHDSVAGARSTVSFNGLGDINLTLISNRD